MGNAAEITCDGERVMAATTDAMAVIDGERYVSVNQPYADLYGFARPDELAGEPVDRRLAEDERARFEREIVPACREDGRWRGTVTGRRRDGSTFAQELSVSRLDDGQFICTSREIGRGDGNERDLGSGPGFLDRVFDAVDDIVYVFSEDGTAVRWNATLRERTGYTDAEIETLDLNELVAPTRRDDAFAPDDAIDRLGERRGVVDLVTRDGERLPHEFRTTTFEDPATGRVYRCALARDVSNRVERERELERYETIVETVGDGVYVLDGNLEFTFVNDALCEMLGRSRDDLRGTNIGDVFAADDRRTLADEMRERVANDDLGTGVVEGTTATPGGEPVHFEVRYRLHPDSDGEYRSSVGVCRDITERKRRENRLRRQRTLIQSILNTIPDVVFAYDDDGDHIVEDALLDEFAGYPKEELAEMELLDFLPAEDRPLAREHVRRVLDGGESVTFETEIVSKDGERIPHEYRAAPMELDGEVLGVAAAARDISERLKRERKLEHQRDELATLNRINELLLEVTRDLVATPTRDAIERTVCDRLAESELYQFAWIGEPETDGDRILPRTSAGVDEGYVDELLLTTTEDGTGQGPAGRAFRTGEVQVSQDVRTDPSFEPWRDAALDRDVRSAAAVPLVHGDTTYGILAVYATRPLAFSRREQAGFETLGKAVGFAINAIENRKLLFADTVVELEFEITDSELVFVRASDRLDCAITITGYVASESGNWSVYLFVDGAAPTAVRDAAADDPNVDRIRVIADEGDEGLLEFVMEGSELIEITERGAVLTAGRVDDGRGRFCIEAPRSTDIRQLTSQLRTAYSDSTLVAQREFDRPVRKASEMRQSIEDRLTDRQREALVRAYHGGYFDWPRRSTAGDVAESMGLAETTFHYHLRNALDTLLAALVDLEDR